MRIGIDLGGTKIEGIVLDDSGRERARVRVATPRPSTPSRVTRPASPKPKPASKKSEPAAKKGTLDELLPP